MCMCVGKGEAGVGVRGEGRRGEGSPTVNVRVCERR